SERSVEAVGNEVEGRPARQLDGVVLVMREDEHRGVVRRFLAPPTAPFLLPGPANRPEHVAPHHVGATWPQEQVASASVGLVERLVEVPRMELDAATAERTLEALVRARDVSVQRDRHVAWSCVHVTSTA